MLKGKESSEPPRKDKSKRKGYEGKKQPRRRGHNDALDGHSKSAKRKAADDTYESCAPPGQKRKTVNGS